MEQENAQHKICPSKMEGDRTCQRARVKHPRRMLSKFNVAAVDLDVCSVIVKLQDGQVNDGEGATVTSFVDPSLGAIRRRPANIKNLSKRRILSYLRYGSLESANRITLLSRIQYGSSFITRLNFNPK